MTTLDLKTFDEALTARARGLARSLTERNQIVIERSADDFDNRPNGSLLPRLFHKTWYCCVR